MTENYKQCHLLSFSIATIQQARTANIRDTEEPYGALTYGAGKIPCFVRRPFPGSLRFIKAMQMIGWGWT